MRQRFGILAKLVRAAPDRPTRFHDGKGNLIRPIWLVWHGPQALLSGLARLLLGYWPERPWISYAATAAIARHLTPQSRVLEYGSGRSTIWLARRSGYVDSIEDVPAWHARVQALLAARALTNVNSLLITDPARYVAFPEDPALRYDLIIVDGSHRTSCVRHALTRLRPGGVLYIDNSDGDLAEAEQLVCDQAARQQGEVRTYTDFAPTQLYVSQGLWYRQP